MQNTSQILINSSDVDNSLARPVGSGATNSPEAGRYSSVVEKHVRSEALRLAWQECMSSMTGCTAAQQKECMESVSHLRSEFLVALTDVQDDDDRTVLTTVFYINLKSRWIMLNIWSSYRIAMGRPDAILMARLGMMSALLDAVEKSLTQEDVSMITEFLAHPVSRPDAADDLLEPLRQKDTVALPSLTHHNSRKLREMREAIAAQEAEMASQREKDAHFTKVFGSADSTVIVSRFQEAQGQLLALQDLQEMLGGVEESMHFVNS